jgi:hypothetical protein
VVLYIARVPPRNRYKSSDPGRSAGAPAFESSPASPLEAEEEEAKYNHSHYQLSNDFPSFAMLQVTNKAGIGAHLEPASLLPR